MTKNTSNYKFSMLTILALGMIIFGVRLDLINSLAVAMPYWDDWGMGRFLEQYVTKGIKFSDLYEPGNQHRSFFSRLLSIQLFNSNNRQWDPMVAMVANSVIWTISGIFLIKIADTNRQHLNITIFTSTVLLLWIFPTSLTNALWGIQSHNYFMILLTLLSCWFIGYNAMSAKWWFGVLCMFAVCLTMGGGSAVPMAILVVYLAMLYKKRNVASDKKTVIAAALGSAFGMMLILIQPTSRAGFQSLDFLMALETFAKSMSFPLTSQAWPFLLLIVPVAIVAWRMLSQPDTPSQINRFLVALYGYVIVIAFAIAIARASQGHGPTRRYMEFVSLAWIATTFALLTIHNGRLRLPAWSKQAMVIAWTGILLVSFPWQIEILTATLKDRADVYPNQERNVRHYINSGGDFSYLDEKPIRDIPLHRADYLAIALDEFKAANILPIHLQVPPQIRPDTKLSQSEHDESPFIVNGSIRPSKWEIGEDYRGEAMMGSFAPYKGGMAAVGTFQSEPIEFSRPYGMIPVTGYLGFEGLSLKFVNTVSANTIVIQPIIDGPHNAESWHEISFKIPRGLYHLVAEDNSSKFWFGFAPPRSMGKLSFLNERLLDHGRIIWSLGILLLIFSQRKTMTNFLQVSGQKQ